MIELIILAEICFIIAIYFDSKTYIPIIESDGKYWVIKVNGRYVDYKYLDKCGPKYRIVLERGDSIFYEDCLIPDLESAKLYLEHIRDYYARGMFIYG